MDSCEPVLTCGLQCLVALLYAGLYAYVIYSSAAGVSGVRGFIQLYVMDSSDTTSCNAIMSNRIEGSAASRETTEPLNTYNGAG